MLDFSPSQQRVNGGTCLYCQWRIAQLFVIVCCLACLHFGNKFWVRISSRQNKSVSTKSQSQGTRSGRNGRSQEPRYSGPLKGPKHYQVESGLFYINQRHMIRWLRDWRTKFISLMIGADIHHFVCLANAEHTLKIIWRMLSIRLRFFSVCSV